MVDPCSDRISRVPPYSRTLNVSTCKGLSPATAKLSSLFHFNNQCHWPGPRSLATTCGVSVDVLSCRYLDVSVPAFASNPYVFRVRYLIYNAWKPVLPIPRGQSPGSFVLTLSRSLRIAALRTARPTMADGLWPCDIFRCRQTKSQQNRFPKHLRWVSHSEVHGSKLIRSSPRLIAAYHVLHRLCMPRHPPNALISLNRSHCLCSSSLPVLANLVPFACAQGVPKRPSGALSGSGPA